MARKPAKQSVVTKPPPPPPPAFVADPVDAVLQARVEAGQGPVAACGGEACERCSHSIESLSEDEKKSALKVPEESEE